MSRDNNGDYKECVRECDKEKGESHAGYNPPCAFKSSDEELSVSDDHMPTTSPLNVGYIRQRMTPNAVRTEDCSKS